MENLAPSLKFILNIRYSLESGRSLNLAVSEYLAGNRDDFSDFLLKWVRKREQGQNLDAQTLKSPTQVVLVHLLAHGLEGQSIYPKLLELEAEVIEKCRLELAAATHKLSFRLLIPLLLLQFPALLVLFLGFLSAQVARSLQ